jgi:hypothetical protein
MRYPIADAKFAANRILGTIKHLRLDMMPVTLIPLAVYVDHIWLNATEKPKQQHHEVSHFLLVSSLEKPVPSAGIGKRPDQPTAISRTSSNLELASAPTFRMTRKTNASVPIRKK